MTWTQTVKEILCISLATVSIVTTYFLITRGSEIAKVSSLMHADL